GDQRVDDLGGAGEGVQGVLDLVGETRDDLAEGREATGADELAGEALLVGEGPLELAPTAALAVGEQAGGGADEVVEEHLEGLVEAASRVVMMAGGEREG